MKLLIVKLLLLLGSTVDSIRFETRGYQLLDPQTGRVLPFSGGSRINFAPPITDEISDSSQRNPRQTFAGLFPETLENNFYYKAESSGSNYYQPYRRPQRKVIPYRYDGQKSQGRYQPSTVSSYAHKKRQQNPYYGRKKRNAEPYTLLDPFTGRNVPKFAKKQNKRNQGSFLFGLPFDLFNDGALKEKKRTQRKTLQKANAPDVGSNPYLSSSGIPVYKYRQKNPLGYGRKKRDAQAPWVLLDPTTGRTLEQNLPVLTGVQDPLTAQFFQPESRGERQQDNSANGYLTSEGVPLYHYRKKYPHGYTG